MTQQLVTKVVGGVVKKAPVSPSSALQAFNTLIEKHHEYQVIANQEKTKRRAIDAWEKTRLAEIGMQKDILQSYLEHSFAERREVIHTMFMQYDKAIASGNNEMAYQALNVITETVKSSPLREVDKLMADLKNPNVQHIEF